jgi:photosystem II stability/assembly factor-like uncharacterized protein
MKTRYFYLILFILSCSFKIYSQQPWTWQQPLPQGNTLYSLSFSDSMNGTAVGILGTIIHTSDCGETWSLIKSGLKNDLKSIFYTDEKNGFISGSSGTLLKTSDGGWNWININTGINSSLNKIQFYNNKTGWCVGNDGTILKTNDYGNTWFKQYLTTNLNINSISILDTNNCIAVGDSGIIYKTTNSGYTWVKQDNSINRIRSLRSVVFKNKDTIYAAGASEIFIISTNGGETWVKKSGTGMDVYDMIILGGKKIFLTGYKAETCDCMYNGALAVSFDDSNYYPWSTTLNKVPNLHGLAFLNNKYLFAIGDRGSIYKFGDNAGNASKVKYLNAYLADLHFFNKSEGIVVGSGGTLLRTTNEGNNWSSQKIDSSYDFVKISFNKEGQGLAMVVKPPLDKFILYSSDRGTTWEKRLNNAPEIYYKIVFMGNNSWIGVGSNGGVTRTSNNGSTWRTQNIPDVSTLYGVFAFDSLFITTVGSYGKIKQTKNGGESWISRDIDSIYYLTDVCFLNSQIGFIVGYDTKSNSGILLRTSDGGENWLRQNPVSISALSKIYFPDNNHGYIIGDRQYIFTTNGGDTWNIDQNVIFDACAMHFIDKDVATMIGTWGSILRTTNGGRTFIQDNPNKIYNTSFSLSQNYPNPFNPSTSITYTQPCNGLINIDVYDILGRKMENLLNKYQAAGKYSINWNAKNFPSGTYFYRITINGTNNNFSQVKSMLLIK